MKIADVYPGLELEDAGFRTIEANEEAFAQAMKDPQLQAEAQKARIPFSYVSPEEIAKDVATLVDQPPEIQQEFAKVLVKKK